MAPRRSRRGQTPQLRLSAERTHIVFDWPIRLWHWAFVAAIATSLATGLSGDVELMDAHLRSGYCVLALLLFRLGWACWGGRHARLGAYRPSPARLWQQLRGRPLASTQPHTPWGALFALVFWWLVAIQVATGLFASDDIFTEGPFASRVSDATVDTATATHTRLYWLVLTLALSHVVAIAWYGLGRKDPVAGAMFTGRKPGPPVDLQPRLARGGLTLLAAVGLVWALLKYA